MLSESLGARIPGVPATKGSMKCVGGRGKVKHQLVDDHKATGPWMKRLTDGIRDVWPLDQRADRDQALELHATFYFTRPANHYGVGRNAARLRDDAPAWPTTTRVGDTDKLTRALCDALQQAEVVVDDAQIVRLGVVEKRWHELGERPAVAFRLVPLVTADPALVP